MQMWRPMHRRTLKDTKRISGMNSVSLQVQNSVKTKKKDADERKTKQKSVEIEEVK